MSKQKMKRLQIDISDAHIVAIDEMMSWSGCTSYREFISCALTLLEWGMEQRRQGRILASVDEKKDSYKEIVMPILCDVKKRRPTDA